MEEQKEHKRRVRYKGTHPRNYNEKYKDCLLYTSPSPRD